MMQRLADGVLMAHVLFVLFVVLGLVLIPVGGYQRWHWIRNLWFRLIHSAAILFVVAQSWLGEICPLTEWENRLRVAAGEAGYSQSFIQHWLGKILFFDLNPRVFTAAYTLFAILVLLAWLWVPPHIPRR